MSRKDLDRRALAHDLSKFADDEFAGFTRINRAAREHPYGSEEYRAGMKQEKGTLLTHFARNSHHPEHWDAPDHNVGPQMMGLLDLVEMTCDWWAAWATYELSRAEEDRGSWHENMQKQRARFLSTGGLSEKQWFVVEGVAALLDWMK